MTNAASLTAALAQEVANTMTARGYSRNGLAEAAGIPSSTLRRRLIGRDPFTIEELGALSSVLNTNIATLLADAEKRAAA